MKYLIDTNILIHILRGTKNFNTKFEQLGYENIYVPYLTKIELQYGAYCSESPDKNLLLTQKILELFRIIQLDDFIFETFVKEKVKLRKKGLKISDFDLLIASTALQNNLILVTENIKDFQNIENLTIENWMN